MTKSVGLGSIEHGLREAFQHLGVERVADAVEQFSGQRKSESLLRKYADPDNSRHHLPLRDALAIDMACAASGHKPPLLMVYDHALTQAQNSSIEEVPTGKICHLALAMDAAAGMVAEAVLQSETCDQCDCRGNHHKEKIYARLLELEATVAKLRQAVMAVNT